MAERKLDNLIERLPWYPYLLVRGIEHWLFEDRRVCLYCVDCEQYEGLGDEGACWYCCFRDIDVDWQDTCRAFKRGKRRDQE